MDMKSKVKYPNIKVQLTGGGGNAFAILARMSSELRRNDINPDEFMKEATSGDYDHLLATCMRWVNVS